MQPLYAATSCNPNPPGTYAVDGIAVPCAPGTYQPGSGATACLPADAGSYVDTSGSATETACAAGTYQALAGQTSCDLAPAGTYVATTGQASATPCPAGTGSLAGATACSSASDLASAAAAAAAGHPQVVQMLSQAATHPSQGASMCALLRNALAAAVREGVTDVTAITQALIARGC